jgi:hypothetical protein
VVKMKKIEGGIHEEEKRFAVWTGCEVEEGFGKVAGFRKCFEGRRVEEGSRGRELQKRWRGHSLKNRDKVEEVVS